MVAVRKPYIPDRGDLVWLNFNPTRGHEQKGKRPALVVTPKVYNSTAGLVLVCPITSAIKGYPFEVIISTGKLKGAVLVDQLRSVDWQERKTVKIGKVSASVMNRVEKYLSKLILEY